MPRFALVVNEPHSHDDPVAFAALAAELSRILDTANRALDAAHRCSTPHCSTCHGLGCDLGICSDCYGSGQRR